MNGEHKTGSGAQGTDATTEVDPAEQARLDAEARARQDPANHPRMSAMDAIAQRHEQQIEEQLAEAGLSSRVTPGEQPSAEEQARTQREAEEAERLRVQREAAGQPDPDTRGGQPQQQPSARTTQQVDLQAFGADPVPMEALDNLKVRIKINGEERVITVQELRRTAQIDGAAMQRLEQANELLRKAREAAGGDPGTQPPVGVEGKPGSGDSRATSKDVTAAAESLVDALFVGDKAAAVATVTQLLAGAQPAQSLDPAAIARQVVPAVKQQLSQEEAEAQFRSDFKEVVSDPILVDVADRFFAEASAADPQKSYAELLTEAGNSTRNWMEARGLKPATGQGPRNTRQEKLEAKARTDEVRGLSRTEVKDEPQIETHSDVIRQMREARGLTT